MKEKFRLKKEDLKPPEKAIMVFFPGELKKVYLGKGDDGMFYTVTKYLDRKTLHHFISPTNIYSETSLQAVCEMYLNFFHDRDSALQKKHLREDGYDAD